jgi:hypothetical protein
MGIASSAVFSQKDGELLSIRRGDSAWFAQMELAGGEDGGRLAPG